MYGIISENGQVSTSTRPLEWRIQSLWSGVDEVLVLTLLFSNSTLQVGNSSGDGVPLGCA